jgi:hypothetical protein
MSINEVVSRDGTDAVAANQMRLRICGPTNFLEGVEQAKYDKALACVANERRLCACLLGGQSTGCNLLGLQNESNLEAGARSSVGTRMQNCLPTSAPAPQSCRHSRKLPRTTK